jgi:hypothetical protein
VNIYHVTFSGDFWLFGPCQQAIAAYSHLKALGKSDKRSTSTMRSAKAQGCFHQWKACGREAANDFETAFDQTSVAVNNCSSHQKSSSAAEPSTEFPSSGFKVADDVEIASFDLAVLVLQLWK